MAGVALLAIIGTGMFLVAMAPCRLRLEPGTLVSYRMRTEVYCAEGRELVRAPIEQDIELISVEKPGQVAMLLPGSGGRHDELTLMQFDPYGRARRFDAGLRLLDEGQALGFFDFNLLPLPPGLEHSWTVDLVYAVPPPGRRLVQARVRRLDNGLRPRFELRLPSIEWLEQRPDERWCQIRDLVCVYRYNGALAMVDEVELTFRAAMETEDGVRAHRFRITLTGQRQRLPGDPVAMGDLALAILETQHGLEDRRRLPVAALAERLRRAADASNGPLAGLGRQLASQLAGQAGDAAVSGWAIQVASVAVSRRPQAEELVRELAADGWPAFLVPDEQRLAVLVGTWPERDQRRLDAMQRRFPRERPLWRRVER